VKRIVLAGMTAMILAGGAAIAQTVVIEPEQRVRIKEYVVKEKVKPVTIKERISIGATLPADVTLTPVPEPWGASVKPYRYVYWDNRVVLVDPPSRRVVHIIE
jgi:hypothetical protein